MLKILSLSALICIVMGCHAQTYDFKKEDKVISLKHGNSTMKFSGYKRISEGVFLRTVEWNGVSYTFRKWMSGSGEIEVVRDSANRLLATTYLDGKSKYNITLPDGKTLVFAKEEKKLMYTQGNQNQIECTIDNKGVIKKVELNVTNREQTSDAVILLSMARATENMKSGSGKGIWIGLAVMGAAATVIGTLMEPAPTVQ